MMKTIPIINAPILCNSAACSNPMILCTNQVAIFECAYFKGNPVPANIKKESAIRTGLLDDSFREKIIPIGNASGTGALTALKSEEFDSRINEMIEKMEYIELSSDPDFVTEYAMNMSF